MNYLNDDEYLAETLKILKQKLDGRHKAALLMAIRYCCWMRRPLPEWARLAFLQAYDFATGFDINRHSPDDSETSVESSDFAASLKARREMWLATSSSGSPNDGRGVDLAIFTGIWTHSSCRLRSNA